MPAPEASSSTAMSSRERVCSSRSAVSRIACEVRSPLLGLRRDPTVPARGDMADILGSAGARRQGFRAHRCQVENVDAHHRAGPGRQWGVDPLWALRQVAFQLERAGEPTYRVRAFRKAAEVLAALPDGEVARR